MSIIIGKRNFAENFSNYSLNDLSFNQISSNKKSKLNEPLSSKNGLNNSNNQKIEMLKTLYPTINQEVQITLQSYLKNKMIIRK